MMKKLLYLLSTFALAACDGADGGRPLRILTCGIRHESNTFSTIVTASENFTVLRGGEILAGDAPWVRFLRDEGVEIVPTLQAYAWPGGIVTAEAYETFRDEILAGIRRAGAVDGIFMDMHGALHVESYDDAQADLIRRIRAIVGRDVVISASFDLHGNVSDEFAEGLDLVTALRTAPHRDGAETRLRAVRNLVRVLRSGKRPVMAHIDIPILVPGEKSITEVEPLRSIYARLDSLERCEGLLDASIFVGYAWADLPRSAMRVFVAAEETSHAEQARRAACDLAQSIWDARWELELDVEAGDVREMIARAGELPQSTVFISDSGDNTTAGAPGDNPQVIEALLESRTPRALVAGLVDEEAFRQCVSAGVGAKLRLTMGGRRDRTFGKPLTADVTVERMSPADVLRTSRGVVLLDASGVKIALLNSRRSFTEKRDFTEIGLDPLDFGIVVVKLGYLYPELRDLAPAHLMALTSGFCNLDMPSLPFRRVRRPIWPLDPDMTWQAE